MKHIPCTNGEFKVAISPLGENEQKEGAETPRASGSEGGVGHGDEGR